MQEHDERTQAAVEAVRSWGELPVVLFLGAGASAAEPLGLPTTANFWERAEESTQCPRLLSLLREVLVEATNTQDVEELWPALQLLEDNPRGLQPLLSLALALHPKQGLDRVGGDWGARQLVDSARDLVVEVTAARTWFRQALFRLYGGFTDEAKAAAATRLFGHFLTMLHSHQEPKVLPIFTTNYDLALEAVDPAALEWRGVERLDGSDRHRGDEALRWEPAHYKMAGEAKPRIPLVKLHGSLNWALREADDCVIVNPASLAERPSGWRDVLVYPGQHEGVEDEWPFAHARRMLQEALAHTKRCVLVGFSMRDKAIADVFQRAMISDPQLRLLLVDRAADWPQGWNDYLRDTIEADDRAQHASVAFGTARAFEAISEWRS